MQYCFTEHSPVGKLLLVGDAEGLRRVSFVNAPSPIRIDPSWSYDPAPFREAIDQLHAYFEGTLRSFTVALNPQGTAFQHQVWRQLQTIPYGATTSYGQVARAIANPRGSRAVGAANRKNPLPILIPCHRVIGTHGQLVGYACGLGLKRTLLSLESRYCVSSQPSQSRGGTPQTV